ncbi:MAG: rRNA maturation RNase YbeY [Chloroflexota bacterium]
MEINILIDEEFADKLDSTWLEAVATSALMLEKAPENSELGLLITTQEHIRELNKEYLGEDAPTDVLSFAMRPGEPVVSGKERKKGEEPVFIFAPDGVKHLGEVIISYPQAEIQAREHGHSVKRELAILLIHGVLHILGYDHGESEAEQKMRLREKAIIESMGSEAE